MTPDPNWRDRALKAEERVRELEVAVDFLRLTDSTATITRLTKAIDERDALAKRCAELEAFTDPAGIVKDIDRLALEVKSLRAKLDVAVEALDYVDKWAMNGSIGDVARAALAKIAEKEGE